MNLPQWWLDMSEKEQAAYLEQHPSSKLAQEGNREPAQPQQPRAAGRQAGDDTDEGPAGPANTTLPKGGQKFRRVVPKAFANRNFHRVMQTDAGAAGRAVLAEDEQASALVAGAATGAETVGLAPRDREKVKGVLHTAMLGMALGLVVLGALMKEQTEPLSDFCDDAADWLVERAGKGPVLDKDGNLVMDAEDTGGNVGYRHQSRAERELQQFLDEAEELAWYRRLQDEARERQALLDARSRRQRVHPKTKQQAGRRMQTYDAAMAMRQLRR